MMMNSKNQLSELLSAMNFPTAGGTLNGVKVISASANMEQDILKYEVVFPKGTKTKQIPSLLSKFFATQIIPTDENLIVRHHDYTVKPKSGKVAVVGAMHILSVVRANPGAQEFDEDYSKMEMTNPETYFRKHQCGPINSPQFRAKMFTFVSLMGENYGYGLDNCVYHRRASLIMPKIKITKAVPQAKMMYHTHPRKDEPSLSSPDDYLLYMDLSHKPRSVRHFYTVMADRMDYFHITPKKDSKNNYLKLDEDGIIKELDAEMNDIEAKWDKKTPKTGEYQDDLRFCENITRDVVKWLNKKYGKYFIIKYKCYYKVKKNPPVPEIDDLHLKDEVVEIALESIKQRTQGLTPPKQDSHEDYAYWHNLRSLDTLQGSAKTLGISPQGSHKRTHQRYMNKAFEDTQYNYHDVLNILNLAHDIAKEDSKIRDGGELLSRMEEICEYLEISETGTETLQFLEDVIHNENLFTEEATTMCGDFYGLALLSSYAIQAVGAVGEIKKGTKEYQLIEYEIYTNLKSETQTRFQDFLVGELERSGKAFGENAPIAQGFVDSFLNPPLVISKRADFEHVFPPEAFAYDFDLVKEALDEFNRNKYDPTKEFITLGKINLRFPVTSGKVSMGIATSTGKAQIFVTGRPDPMEDAIDAVTKVGTALVRYGLPIDPEEYDVQAIDVAQNPQTSQVIAIAGPSGAGKSTTIRSLLKLLPNSKTVPTVTTRPKRKSDKPGERVFTSSEKFKKDMKKGNMVAAQLQKNGNYYGRRKSDFEGADYVIIDVNLKGINSIKRAYPNAFTVYLEPVEDPEFIRKRLLRRGDMSPQEARGRASIIPSHIKDSKNMDFDARIQTKQGEFAKIALELEPMIPKQNPPLRDLVSKIFSRRRPSITWNREQKGVGIPLTPNEYGSEQGDVIEEWPITQLEELFKKDEGYYIPPQSEPSGKVLRIAELAEQGVPLPVPAGGSDGRGPFSFTDGRHRFVYTRDFTNDKTIPIAASIRRNPSKKPKTIRIEESPNKEKKLVAYFYDKDGKKFRTVHFGARGMSDYTQHKNPDRMKSYLARHGGMGENWKDPMTAGALSRWILWGKPSLRDSFNDFKKRFKLEGVMAVTNTRMNPPTPHDGDAIITIDEVPWGTQIIAECPFDGTKGGVDPWMEDACNHIYPPCGHVLRINPDKPCCCENSEHPSTHPDHYRPNPSNIPFPIPEEYQEELETRLAEEMTRPGYRPHTIPEVIEEGLYDDAPSDFSYAQGEYEEFLEEIEKGDLDEAYAEYSDVEGHVAYWLYTNHRVIMPIYAQSHVAKTRGRIQIFKDLFEHYGYEHSPAYLKGGSNHEKVFKVRAALDAAADAQGKPRITDNDDQLSFVVRNIVEARKNPPILTPWAVFIVGKVGDKYAATTRDDGRIGLPGGKVDAGESGKVAVMREATEEGWRFPKETNLTLIHQQDVEGKPIDWYMADTTPSKLSEYKEKHRGIKPILITEEELRNSGFGNENLPLHRKNPMAPGYQSYGWTTQDWRSIKVNNKGKIDYSQKCGAEGTKTPSGSPRLCLPAAVVKSLIRTESGKEVIRTQARKKARAKKGERVPWHPRIKKIWKRIEDKTVKDKPNPPVRLVSRPSTEDNVSRFFDKNSGKELTGKVFANATLDTSNGLTFEVGEEVKPTEMVGIKRRYNVAKWGDRTVIQRDPRSKEFYEKIDFKLPVHLEHDPMSLSEPSAFVTTRGVMVIDRSEDNFTLVHPSEITDFQGNAKNDTNIPIPVYKYAKVVKRTPGIMGGPLENPPSFISARDPQKWSDRYDRIIKMSGDELMQLAEKQAAEKGLTIELTIRTREYKETPRQLKLPPKQQKMYKEYIESIKRATITLSRGNKLIDTLRFTILTQSPKELVDYLTNRKVWRKESNGKSLPQIGSVRTRYVSNKSQRMFRVSEIPMVATLQNNKRFPFAVAGGGGYQMSEGQTSKGYYGIIKTYQAGFLEANNMEQYGLGASPMRSDLYQSYGWLTAYSYKDNYPYPSRAAEYYLNLHGTTKLANKDADYENIYRPVYSRKMTGAAYRAGVKKMLDAVTNPPEWRHGEFAEEDPFEEYF